MMELNRAQYLQTHWEPYPTLPEQSVAWGVVQEKNRRSDRVDLKIEDKNFILHLSQQNFRDLEFCQPNDIVSIDPHGELRLLVPSLGEAQDNLNLEMQKKWNSFFQSVRTFFNQLDFLEVQTPSLTVCPGTEPTLEVFQTEFEWGSQKKSLFLPTSPELSLKKYICHAVRQNPRLKIFEIAKVFRNGEITERHHPEFFMLEWYRCFQSLDSIAEDIVQLVSLLARRDDFVVQKKTMQELFLEHVDFHLTPDTTAEELKLLSERLGINSYGITQFDDLFQLIFLEKIETQWPKENLFFVEKYPPSQAALARVDDNGWAERFEFYWQGLEIANAFHELNDPMVQRERMKRDLALKASYGRKEIPRDEIFLKSLEYGMPPTSGVALGMERLFMALHGIKNISEIKMNASYRD